MPDIVQKDVINSDHHCNLASTVEAAFQNGEFTDIILTVGGERYHCHKIVLASATPYFKSMFKSGLQESHSKEVNIKGIDKESFSLILTYIYSGQVTVNFDNVESLLRASDMLDLANLFEGCRQFLEENISADNCFSIWQLADLLGMESLVNQVKNYALDNFADVVQTEKFSVLNLNYLVGYVKNGFLKIGREETVVNAILNWLGSQDYDLSEEDANRLFSAIDISSCDPYFVQRNIIQNKHLDIYKNFTSKAQMIVNHHIFHQPMNDCTCFPAIPRYRTDIVPSLIVIGGRKSNGSWSTEVNCITQSDVDTYTEYRLSALPSKIKACTSIATINNNMYITFLGNSMAEMWKYNGVENQWNHLRNAITDRRCHSSVALFTPFGPHVYVLGGCQTVYSNSFQTCSSNLLHTVDKYSISTNKWETCGNLNHEVCYAAAVSWKDDIFLFSGRTDDTLNCTSRDIIQKYDTLNNTCTDIHIKMSVEFPKVITHGKFCILLAQSKIILFDLESLNACDNEVCTPVVKKTDLEFRYFTGVGILYDNLVIFGGRKNPHGHTTASDNLIIIDIKQILEKDSKIIAKNKGAVLSTPLSLYSCATFKCANPIVVCP